MARRTSSRSSRTSAKPERTPRARSRKGSAATATVVEDEASAGGEAGIAIMTTVVLVVALVCVDMLLGRYGSGVFF